MGLLERHLDLTGSSRAALLLADREAALARFRRVVPRAELVAEEVTEEPRVTA